MAELIDITVAIRPGMVVYPGDPPVSLERLLSMAEGSSYNFSRLDLGVHAGTHVDAPLHFVDDGAAAESLALDVLVGHARVVDLTAADRLDAEALEGVELSERTLLKTRNSDLWERDEYVPGALALTADAARVLVDGGVRLVGIDYLSIGDEEAHRVLLGAGVVALESIDLRGVEPGDYELICAPLKLVGADGAPARALLRR